MTRDDLSGHRLYRAEGWACRGCLWEGDGALERPQAKAEHKKAIA